MPLLSVMLGSCSDVIYENEDFSWSSEKVTQGDYSAYAKSESEIVSNYPLPDGSAPAYHCAADDFSTILR